MLHDFFNLNAPTQEWTDVVGFKASLREEVEIGNMQYTPDELKKAAGFTSVKGKTFRNVSFSKTRIVRLSFRDCRFEDCLFIDTEFSECEFHHCAFKNCNFYKASFRGTYVDPDAFLLALDASKYANIGVALFQSLSRDLANQNQHVFRAKAEFLFEKWVRYQLRWNMEMQHISRLRYNVRCGWRLFLEVTTGYGWKPVRLITTILVSYVVLLFANHLLWNTYGIRSVTGVCSDRSLVNDVYYTSTLLTTLGPMGLTPTTSVGLVIASVHSIIGILFFALLASLTFRLVVKRA